MATYTNRVYDSVAADFVRWDTASPDTGGGSYPGPDAFGSTVDFTIESVTETAGAGEANTASNVGAGTVGVFKQKTGVDLEFRELLSTGDASNVLTLALAGGGDEVELQLEHQLAQTSGSGGNTAYGVGAGNVGTISGTSNTAVGEGAAKALTTGGNTVAVGNNAAPLLAGGSNNIALGASALTICTSGSSNIVIGTGSLPNVLTGSDNLYIGHGLSGSTDSTHQMNIGDILFADKTGAGSSRLRFGGSGEVSGQTEFALIENTNADTVPVLALETTGANGAKTNLLVGNQTPIGNVTGTPGDEYTRVDGTSSEKYIHVGAGSDNTSWATTVGGETNTTSNTGTGDAGFFKSKVGSDLVFRDAVYIVEDGNEAPMLSIDVAGGGSEVEFTLNNMYMSDVEDEGATYFGVSAGDLGTSSGDKNSAFGTASLSGLTSGESNSALGYRALENLDTGTGNVAIGQAAGVNLTSGGNNVLLGSDVASGVLTGNDNFAVGFHAGNALTSGSNNILLGDSVGDTLTTGSNNILIGDSIVTPAAGTSNYMSLADVLFGDLSLSRIGVNTSVPSGTLDVVDTNIRWILQTNSLVNHQRYGATQATSPRYSFRRARGTSGTPTGIQANDYIGRLEGEAWYDDGGAGAFSLVSPVEIRFEATEAWTDITHGSRMTFWTTPTGATAKELMLDIDEDKIGFFATTPVVQASAYTPTNVVTDRTYDADSTTVAELADVLGTLIADLQAYGLLQ